MVEKDENYYPEAYQEYDKYEEKYITKYKEGVSVRTQLAAMAMQGILAATPDAGIGLTTQGIGVVSETAVRMADALIAELNK